MKLKNTGGLIRFTGALTLAACYMLLGIAWSVVCILAEEGYAWLKGHCDCPGPTGWAPGRPAGCGWCLHRSDVHVR